MIDFNSKNYVTAQVASLAVVVVAVALVPGVSFIHLMVTFMAVWVVALLCYRLNPYQSTAGAVTLMVAWMLLSVGIVANIHYFTNVLGGTLAEPALCNTDAYSNYYVTYHYVVDGERIVGTMFPLFYGMIMRAFGANVLTMLAVNALAIMLSIVIAGYLCGRFCGGNVSGYRASTLGMALLVSICYFMTMGTLCIREAIIILAMSLVGLSMALFCDDALPVKGLRGRWWWVPLFFVGAVLLALARPAYLFIALLGALCFLRFNKRSIAGVALCGAMGTAVYACQWFAPDGPTALAYVVETGGDMPVEYYVYYHQGHEVYDAFVARYMSWPLWLRALCLPLTAGVQFFVPLIFNPMAHVQYGVTNVYAHFGFPWYCIGGMIIYYVLFCLKGASGPMRRLTLWGVVAWLIPAFMTGGLVSRYTLAFLPLLMPAAVSVASTCMRQRKFCIFASVFAAAVVLTLVAVYFIQYR